MFPGFGYGGLSKKEIFELTYPQLIILLRVIASLENEDEKDKFENIQGEVPPDQLNAMIKEWRAEIREKEEHANN
ncbi:MAG: hypothetical protein GTO02_16575 [Candidatus Dadabacteria bacterium]|nr:hypothetical protein [Candidatus Dadabacteria bacterium]